MLNDIINIAMRSTLTKGLVSKILTKALVNKTGPKTEVQVISFELGTDDSDTVTMHLDFNAKLDKEFIEKLIADQLKSR